MSGPFVIKLAAAPDQQAINWRIYPAGNKKIASAANAYVQNLKARLNEWYAMGIRGCSTTFKGKK